MLGSFGVFLMVFLSPFILWPIGGLVRRIRKQAPSATAASKLARWLDGIVSGLNLIFLAGYPQESKGCQRVEHRHFERLPFQLVTDLH